MPYDEFEDLKSEFSDDDIADIAQEEKPESEPDINNLAQSVDSDSVGSDKGSILDDETSLSALGLLKQLLREKGCILADFRIGFDPTGFDIKGVQIKCRDPKEILNALKDVEAIPGQLKPQSMYDKMPNSYSITAILGDLKSRAENELGLSVRAAAYENDFVVISFFPAEEKVEPPMLDMGMPPEIPEEIPGEEKAPEEEKPGGPEVPEEGVPPTEIDWEELGI